MRVHGVQSLRRHLLGTEVRYQTIASMGEAQFFDALARELAGKRIYLSLDKDSLQRDAAVTDWEQGCLSLPGLLYGIRRLMESCEVAGADVCGEHAPDELAGFFKRLDAKRFKRNKLSPYHANEVNQKTNLELLLAFTAISTSGANRLCPA